VEVHPSAFAAKVWRDRLRFAGPPLFLINGQFIRSALFHHLSLQERVSIGSVIEVIGVNAFERPKVSSVCFDSGTRLREIRSEAFARYEELTAFNVPESVEMLGDRCFVSCSKMETIEFAGASKLKRIGELAFAECQLHSGTIPALAEEVDGSAFVNCPLIEIRIAPESLNFKVVRNLLVTSDGTAIVRWSRSSNCCWKEG
jgi:hypothetical protein